VGKKSPVKDEVRGNGLDETAEHGDSVEHEVGAAAVSDTATQHDLDLTGNVAHGEDPGAEDLIHALQVAEDEIGRHKDALLRVQAEAENQRKRQIRELEKSRKFALERFASDLLPVHDSLDRCLHATDVKVDENTLREGSELTLKLMLKAMQDHGLETIDPLGEHFDPEWHEAISVQEHDEYPANTVVLVIQKGFKLNDRLVRPAMVIVTPS
jgi:molecular chaperone GrpE